MDKLMRKIALTILEWLKDEDLSSLEWSELDELRDASYDAYRACDKELDRRRGY